MQEKITLSSSYYHSLYSMLIYCPVGASQCWTQIYVIRRSRAWEIGWWQLTVCTLPLLAMLEWKLRAMLLRAEYRSGDSKWRKGSEKGTDRQLFMLFFFLLRLTLIIIEVELSARYITIYRAYKNTATEQHINSPFCQVISSLWIKFSALRGLYW